MITAGDFKKGITIEWDGGVWNIVDFQHVKPGKGAAFVRTKIKNVMTGAVVERSFNPTDKMPKAIIETKEMQYVYNDGDLYYFMDTESYEQLPLSKDQVDHQAPPSLGFSRQEHWSGLPFPSLIHACDPIDVSPPGSSVPGVLQARILEWVAISFSNACMHAKSLQLCPILCDPMDSSPPGSSVHRIL